MMERANVLRDLSRPLDCERATPSGRSRHRYRTPGRIDLDIGGIHRRLGAEPNVPAISEPSVSASLHRGAEEIWMPAWVTRG